MTALYVWLLDTSLKGSLLILFVAVIHWLVGARVDARWRHLLWVVVLLRLVVPSVPSSSWSLFNVLPRVPSVSGVRLVAPERPALDLDNSLSPEILYVQIVPERPAVRWVVGTWLLGAGFFLLRMLIAASRMHRAIPRGRQQETDRLPAIETDLVRSPALHGLFRPVLLLPVGFRSAFSDEELRHVMLHEQWHVKRMDVAVSWLLAFAQALHWFNPLVWFAASRIREERELACDELALSLLEEDERPGYGTTILKLLDRFRSAAPVPALVGIVNQKQKMKRRLTMIASYRNERRYKTVFLALVCALTLAGLTDAQSTHLRFARTLDPAAAATAERLRQPISFEVNRASLGELLAVVSNKTGVTISQAAEIASLDVQNARFTIKAEEVAAHLVLREALMSFKLMAEPGENVVTIKADEEAESRRVLLRSGEHLEHTEQMDGNVTIRILKRADGEAAGERQHFVLRKHDAAEPGAESGLRRQIDVRLDQNGVKSEGKLTIQIEK